MVHSALTTRFAITSDKSSRGGARITSIGHHHAASTNLEGTLGQFQPGGREVSPNYCIEGRNIVLVVEEEFRAWTSADAWADGQSITYEIINSNLSWQFTAETIASVVALDIDICRRYGITPKWGLPGLWQHRNLWEWFGRSYATACAGPYFPQDHIVSAVSAGLAGTAGGGIEPISSGGNNMYLMRTVDGTISLVTEDGIAHLTSMQTVNLLQRMFRSYPNYDTFNAAERDLIMGAIAGAQDFDDAQTAQLLAAINNVKITVDTAAITEGVVTAIGLYLAEHGVEVDTDGIATAVDGVLKDDFAAIPGAVVHEYVTELSD